MGFIELLKQASQDERVNKHLFLISYDKNKDIIHAFFEGKTDESFYGTYIRNIKSTNTKLKTYICGNKSSVYHFHDELNHLNTVSQPLIFFVDKDLDDVIPIPNPTHTNLYVTEYYSIENYIVNEIAIEQIWAEIFRRTSGTKLCDEVTSIFKKAHKVAQGILIDVMAWVLMHRRKGSRPPLNNIKTKELFSLDEKLTLSPLFETEVDLYKRLDDFTKINTNVEHYDDIKLCKAELLNHPIKSVVRGHNEVDFFIQFIKTLKSSSEKLCGEKITSHVEITGCNIIDIIGPRTKIPAGLDVFLKENITTQKILI